MNRTQPAVFISYSHDSDAHKERVRALSERLRVDGINCQIDQYIQNPPEGWPRWCECAIETSNFVLVVCTETYHRRYSGREEAGKGKGVTFEGYIITQQFYDKGSLNEKFLPVLFAPEDENFIPTPLRGASRYLVKTAGGYEALYRLLTGQPAITPPPIGTPRILPPRPSVVAAITDQSPRTFLVKLPTTSSLLFGREQELAVLDQAWQDRHTRIVTLVAMGGAGKSALVNEWLNRLERDNYRGAVRVYGWSFYSQGAREDGQASADEFLDHALGWFGDTTLAKNASAWDKGIQLAEVIGNQPALLILDGLEPLQYPPGEMYGRLKDQGLQALLKALARNNLQTGLCVATTRVGVTDLEHFLSGPVRRLDLESLDPEAGEKLLSSLGVTGVPAELRQAAGEFGGHALALTLLGTYLAAVHDGDIRQRDKVGSLFDEEKKGGQAKRVMATYCQWLAGRPELDILFLMGLFDRPADGGAIGILRNSPAIVDLTSQLAGLTEAKWKTALANLRDLRLLSPKDQARPDTLDCHPLVREYFGDLLRDKFPRAWQEGNLQLYKHYKGVAKEYPDTIEKMAPLFYACYHGCRAGRQQEALVEVYWKRIKRGNEHYCTRKLGAFGSDLAALANFFDSIWDRPAPGLAEMWQAWILGNAGFRLKALGRLAEAKRPMRDCLEMCIRQRNWSEASKITSNLSELFLDLGEMAWAVEYGQQTVELAARSGDRRSRVIGLTTHAVSLHQAGQLAEAEELFRQAEAMQREEQLDYPMLYSLRGFQYCDLLFDLYPPTEVWKRAKKTLGWTEKATGVSLLDIGLDHLTMGRACQRLGEPVTAATHLAQAIDFLRKANFQEILSRGILARAAFCREQGQFVAARRDLDEVLEIAERCGMRLFLTDYHLESCRLGLAENELPTAREHLDRARKLVAETGYHRRDRELQDLEELLAAADTAGKQAP